MYKKFIMFQSVRDFKISKYAVLTVKYISTVKYIKIEMLKKQQFLNYLVTFKLPCKLPFKLPQTTNKIK